MEQAIEQLVTPDDGNQEADVSAFREIAFHEATKVEPEVRKFE